MLPALAVAEVVRDQNQAPLPGPGHSHILQLALRLGVVVAVGDQNSRHRPGGPGRHIKVGGHHQTRPALEDEVIDAEAVALERARDEQSRNLRLGGRKRERLAQCPQPRFAEPLPVRASLHLLPVPVLPQVG